VNKWSDDELSNRNQVVANLYSLIGNAHLELSDYGKANENHQKDLDISTEQ
jgi:hypothetical protein